MSTVHLTEIVKDIKSEVHLCERCAREIGLKSDLSGFSVSMPQLAGFMAETQQQGFTENLYCKSCGMSYEIFTRTGRLGCPDCYVDLAQSLKDVIESIHHGGQYRGQVPEQMQTGKVERIKPDTSTQHNIPLEEQLNAAVAEERYEDAALLRDLIRNGAS